MNDGGRVEAHLRRVPRPGGGSARAGRLTSPTAVAMLLRSENRRRHPARYARGRAEPGRAAAHDTGRRHVPVQRRTRPHRARDQTRVSSRVLQQGAAHVGGQALRRQDAALRHAAAGTRHRPARRATSCAACATRASKSASIAGTTSSGRTASMAPAPNGRGEQMQLACERFTDIFKEPPLTHGAAGWQMNVHALRLTQVLGFELLLRRPRRVSASSGVERRAGPLPAASDDAADARRIDRQRRRHGRQRRRDAAGDDGATVPVSPVAAAHVFTLHAELEGMRSRRCWSDSSSAGRRRATASTSMRRLVRHAAASGAAALRSRGRARSRAAAELCSRAGARVSR